MDCTYCYFKHRWFILVKQSYHTNLTWCTAVLCLWYIHPLPSFLYTHAHTHTRVRACTCTLQPIISFCRCKPGGKFRWIFNLIHGNIIGWGVIILACECVKELRDWGGVDCVYGYLCNLSCIVCMAGSGMCPLVMSLLLLVFFAPLLICRTVWIPSNTIEFQSKNSALNLFEIITASYTSTVNSYWQTLSDSTCVHRCS